MRRYVAHGTGFKHSANLYVQHFGAGLVTATSLDIRRPASPAADTPPQGRRHAAHARFEAARSSGSGSMLPSGRRHHDASRPATATTAEAELLQRWPHGLPVSWGPAFQLHIDVSLRAPS